MAAQISFPLFLYATGLIPIWFVRRRVDVAFLAWTAFAWGALAWVVSTMLCLLLRLPVSLFTVLLMTALIVSVLVFWKRRQASRLESSEVRTILLALAMFAGVVSVSAALNMSQISPDSVVQLLAASELAEAAYDAYFLREFGFWGPMLIMLHAPASWLGLHYFDTLQPAFVLTLFGSFFVACRLALAKIGVSARGRTFMSILPTLLLGTTPFVLFQTVYIHNNVIAATYTLIGVAALWMALRQRSMSCLYLAATGFLGLSLARTETTLFATIFIVAGISAGIFSRRQWLKALGPYGTLLLTWNLWLLLVVRPETHILTPERILIILGLLTALMMGTALLHVGPIRQWIAPHLHQILIAALVLTIVSLAMLDVHPLLRATESFLLTLFGVGWSWWAFTWWFVAVWILLTPKGAKLPQERLLVVGISGFWLLLLAISYAHGFSRGWGGSGNRAALHILPVMVYYLTLKTAAHFFPEHITGVVPNTP